MAVARRRIAGDRERPGDQTLVEIEQRREGGRPGAEQRNAQSRAEVVDANLSAGEGEDPVAEVAAQRDLLDEGSARAKGLAPQTVVRLGRNGRRVDRRSERIASGTPPSSVISNPSGDGSSPQRDGRSLDERGRRRNERRKRKPDVGDHRPSRRLDEDRGVVVGIPHAAERSPRPETELRQEGIERGDAGEAGAPGAEREVVVPENVGPARLRGGVRDVGVAHDLRGVLEEDLRVEPRIQGFEEARPRLGPGEVEGVEDLVGCDHRAERRATMSFRRNRASSLNQKSRNGSWSRAWSNLAIAAARERSLIAA